MSKLNLPNISTILIAAGFMFSMRPAFSFDLIQTIKQCAPESHWDIVYQVVQVESSGNPLAINVNARDVSITRPGDFQEAEYIVGHLFEQGYSVDIGLAQINTQHFLPGRVFEQRGFRPEDALDPCINLKMASYLLSDAYRRYNGDILATLSVYNTGHPEKGILNGYLDRFIED